MVWIPAICAADAPVIRPGHPRVTGKALKAYTNQWTMYRVAKGVRTRIGVWTDKLELIRVGGRAAFRRTQVVNERTRYVNVADRATLRPITRETQVDGKRTQHVTFGAREQAFDWTLYGLLLACFPLEVGYRARFAYVDLATRKHAALGFGVSAKEKVVAGKSKVSAFKVTTDQKWTFWLIRKAPYILRLDVPNKDGSVTRWLMEDRK